MNAIWLVARREIRERLKSRTFRVATIISAGVVIAAIAIPAAQRGKTPTYDVGVVNPALNEVAAISAYASPLKLDLRVRPVRSVGDGRAGLRSGTLDVVVVGNSDILVKRVPEAGDTGKKTQLLAAIEATLRLQRAAATAGPAGEQVLAALRAPVSVRGVEAHQVNTGQRLTAFYGVVLLFVFMQQYGAWVLMGVIEEKASRVVEVLLSAVSPRRLVAGKVVGIGTVALVQGAIVAAAALITSSATGSHVFTGASRYMVLWTLVWFVLGYSLYAWAYAAVGSTVSRQADAQSAAFPVAIPVIVSYIAATSLLSGGEPSTFARVLAFLPPTAPMVMPMFIGIGKAAPWEAAVSIIGVVVSIAVLVRVAGDIYARAILHTGQRLRLRAVLRHGFTAA